MDETKLREEICRFGRSLFERGLTPGSSGNISVRLDDGGWLVTPTNASLGSLEAAVFAMEELEETAKLYLLLRGLNPRYLTPAQMKDLAAVFNLPDQQL